MEKIRVLIADDSPVVREILKDMIEGEPDLEIVGEASNGRDAVSMAERLRPSIITMDVLMPVMNGLEAVEEIMAFSPTPILIFSSALDDKELDVAFQAIARGALDVMEKPKVPSGDHYEQIRRELIEKLKLLSRIHVIPHLRGKRKKAKSAAVNSSTPAASTPSSRAARAPGEKYEGHAKTAKSVPAPEPMPSGKPMPEPEPARIETIIPDLPLVQIPPPERIKRKLVAIGSSTGGPKALVQIFRRIPADFPLPILVVQHIAMSFAPGLVTWLNRESALNVVLAEDKKMPVGGTVYISPTGVHLVLENGLIRLIDSPPVNSCRPSVDVMFSSIARTMGEHVVAILLTGMGRDGAKGMQDIKEKKGKTIVQDQASSVIFGMPKAAIELGAADEVVTLAKIPDAMVKAIIR